MKVCRRCQCGRKDDKAPTQRQVFLIGRTPAFAGMRSESKPLFTQELKKHEEVSSDAPFIEHHPDGINSIFRLSGKQQNGC